MKIPYHCEYCAEDDEEENEEEDTGTFRRGEYIYVNGIWYHTTELFG